MVVVMNRIFVFLSCIGFFGVFGCDPGSKKIEITTALAGSIGSTFASEVIDVDTIPRMTEEEINEDRKYLGLVTRTSENAGDEARNNRFKEFVDTNPFVDNDIYGFVITLPITSSHNFWALPKAITSKISPEFRLGRCSEGESELYSIGVPSNVTSMLAAKPERPEENDANGLFHYTLYSPAGGAARNWLLNDVTDLCLNYFFSARARSSNHFTVRSNEVRIPAQMVKDMLDNLGVEHQLSKGLN